MTPTDDRPPAGWYADPSGAPLWRYWDGAQWTDHTAPRTLERPPAAVVADERRWAAWARWALCAYVALVAGSATLGALYFDDVYRGTLFDQSSTARPDTFGGGGVGVGYQLCAFGSLAVIAVLATWTYRSAKAARSLGITIRRDPGLAAAGWFIPLVNLWWPPQTIRSFVPDRAQLRVVLEWWACWIITSLSIAGSLIAAGASSLGAAVPFVIVAVLGACAFALLGFHVVRIVLAVHEHMAAEAEHASA